MRACNARAETGWAGRPSTTTAASPLIRQGDKRPSEGQFRRKTEGVVGKRRRGKVLEDVPDPEHLQGQFLPPPTEKRPRPFVGRAEQQVAQRPALDDPAAVDQNDLLRQPPRLGDVVRHEDDRFAEAGVQAQKFVLNRFARAGVERAERLIHQEEVGVGGQRPGDADPLPLAARQLRRRPPAELALGQAHHFQDFRHPPADPRPRPAEQPRYSRHVRRHVQVRKQAALLDHVADGAAERLGPLTAHVPAADQHFSRRRVFEPIDQSQGGRFAAAARPQEGDDAADRDL